MMVLRAATIFPTSRSDDVSANNATVSVPTDQKCVGANIINVVFRVSLFLDCDLNHCLPNAGLGLLLPSNSSGRPCARQETASFAPSPKCNYINNILVLCKSTKKTSIGLCQTTIGVLNQPALRCGGIGAYISTSASLSCCGGVHIQLSNVNGQWKLQLFYACAPSFAISRLRPESLPRKRVWVCCCRQTVADG